MRIVALLLRSLSNLERIIEFELREADDDLSFFVLGCTLVLVCTIVRILREQSLSNDFILKQVCKFDLRL